MADVKFSALSAAPAVAATDIIPCVVSSTTYKATALQIATATKDSTLTLTGKTISGASNTLTVRLANDVTGTLPVANGGTGVASAGTSGNVLTSNGSTWSSAAPAIDIGNVSGLGTGVATWATTPSGANLASALTSALPVSKGGTNRTALGSALQVLRTNAGATDTEWATISGGGGTPGGSSGEIQTNDGAGGFAGATNVKAGSGYVSVGTAVSSTGAVRLANAANGLITASDGAGGLVGVAAVDASANLVLGADHNGALNQINNAYVYASNTVLLCIGGSAVLSCNASNVLAAQPVIGSSAPWAGMNGLFSTSLSGSTYTLLASEYCMSIIQIAGSGSNTIVLPSATDAQAYIKYVWNTGSGTLAIQDAGGHAISTSLAAGTAAFILVSLNSVKRMHTAFAPT